VSSASSGRDEARATCEGTLTVSDDGVGVCDAGSSCRALDLRDDAAAYRAAHERVVTQAQTDNKVEYGGEG
jgi:hypothetical protein